MQIVTEKYMKKKELNKMEKTSDADMQRLYDYMDKMGISYTINRNPSPEEIKRVKALIEKNEKILGLKR